MKILIVDDEALALARLKRMLHTLGYEDITEADNPALALECMKEERFDLALLDINMPGTNGLELGYELRYQQESLAIIFQTAYDKHALKAFDIGAVGYLVKPFSMEQLQQSIERVKFETKSKKDFRLMSKNGENYYLFKPEEVYYVKADLSEVMLRSVKGFSYYAHKISDLEKQLLGHDFVRMHRSYLININKIKEMETIEQSKLRFSFHDISDQIESSKDGAKAFRNQFTR
ncbi:MAG: LytTR family DNA-binding domain-containing protein [Campylobacterota bacterium]|nr:LytTR family DNA-binding domain-containing protein [Campylobacterota bacterium]